VCVQKQKNEQQAQAPQRLSLFRSVQRYQYQTFNAHRRRRSDVRYEQKSTTKHVPATKQQINPNKKQASHHQKSSSSL
jgi:hypothetical protein